MSHVLMPQKLRRQQPATQLEDEPSELIRVSSEDSSAHISKQPAPTELIPEFLRRAADEVPWHFGLKSDKQDIEHALRTVRIHYEATYPDGSKYDWVALSENCKLRLHFTVQDELDFSCPTLGHLFTHHSIDRDQLIKFFLSSAEMAEERAKRFAPIALTRDDSSSSTAATAS